MKFVLGSKNGSTGDYCASVVWSRFQNDLGVDSLPVALAKPSEQTQYIFEKAQLGLPTIQTELEEGSSIDIVNHTSAGDSIQNRDTYIIDSVIDCHPVDLHTIYNIETRTAQVGSTCTVIAELFIDKVYIPEMNYLLLLLFGIIVDTNNFSSSQSTDRDEEAYLWLKELVNIDGLDEYMQEMLEKAS